MTTAALQNVWNGLLANNLTAANKRWLAERLLEDVQGAKMSPYTQEELEQMAENGRQQIASGMSYTTDQVIEMCERA